MKNRKNRKKGPLVLYHSEIFIEFSVRNLFSSAGDHGGTMKVP